MTQYRVNGTLAHGEPIMVTDEDGYSVPKRDKRGQPMSKSYVFNDGDYVDSDLLGEENVKALRFRSVLSTPEEYAQAQAARGNLKPLADMVAERERSQALALENAALKARIEELERASATPVDGLVTAEPEKSTDDSEAAPEASEAEAPEADGRQSGEA